MSRSKIREEVFKLIFQADFHTTEEFNEIADQFDPEGSFGEDRAYIISKSKDLIAKIDEIDASIDAVAEGWKTKRMAKVDLTIIRLAVYEIKYEELAAGIAINEAVELAKKYGEESSGSFVNGVLAKLA